MATSEVADKLIFFAVKLDEQLERQQSKGSDCITLCPDEVIALIEALRDGFANIDGFINGGI